VQPQQLTRLCFLNKNSSKTPGGSVGPDWHHGCSIEMRRAALAARLPALVFRWSIRLTNNLPAWLQGESKDTPCPANVQKLPVSSYRSPVRSRREGELVTGNWKLETDSYNVVRGAGAAGISSGRRRLSRAYAAVTSTP
jgi:hypothetical protein